MKESNIYTALAGVIGIAALIYVVKQRRGTLPKKKGVTATNSEVVKPQATTAKGALTLDKMTVNIPQRQFILKDRQKFLDDWAAEEGGVQAIRDMYKKRPSAFPKADIVYLQSKGILPSENLVGRGITTTIV